MTNNNGRVFAPELRAVFEVESTASARPYPAPPSGIGKNVNFLTDFGVSPAYQFDIFIVHPDNITNLATVAQRVYTGNTGGRNGQQFAVRTYDTHGTENKGFRKDEKLAREGKK
jgi:hypothetical protein